jgi:pimeloyl-ACP methyl ester carboxylesterase
MLLALLAVLTVSDTNVVRDVQVGDGEVLRTTSIGTGQPILLIPGIFGGAFSFRHLTGPLAESGYRCIVIEPLGFGSSSHPGKADYSFAAQADRIGRALDSLGATDALVVAQSTGAAIAYRLSYHRPDLVRGLLSIDGGPSEQASTPGLRHALRFGGFLTKLFVGPGTIRKKVRHDLIANSADTTWVTDTVVDEYTVGQAADVDGAIDGLRSMAKSREPESLRARIHESRAPVRLLRGTFPHPSSIKPDEIALLRDQLTDFADDSVPGAGQYLGEEHPAAVLAAIHALAAIAPLRSEPGSSPRSASFHSDSSHADSSHAESSHSDSARSDSARSDSSHVDVSPSN